MISITSRLLSSINTPTLFVSPPDAEIIYAPGSLGVTDRRVFSFPACPLYGGPR